MGEGHVGESGAGARAGVEHLPARGRWRRWLWRLLGLSLVLMLAGAVYQAAATAADARRYPPPGQRIDVGGHRLHLYCMGSGLPTVIMEAGAGGFSLHWGLVQPELAKTTRVCSYDRAGLGWSDPRPGPTTSRGVAHELHELLTRAGVPGPYVLVGHSIGGFHVRFYAAEHPEQVAGMVLVDPSVEDADRIVRERFPELSRQGEAAEVLENWVMRAGAALASFGVLRLADVLGLISLADMGALPFEDHGRVRALFSQPRVFWWCSPGGGARSSRLERKRSRSSRSSGSCTRSRPGSRHAVDGSWSQTVVTTSHSSSPSGWWMPCGRSSPLSARSTGRAREGGVPSR